MRYQFSMRDLFLAVVPAAALTATIVTQEGIVVLGVLGCMLLFVWHRPVLMRFWAVLTLGLGSGIAAAMVYRGKYPLSLVPEWSMLTDELAGWGFGMVVGGLVACWAFIRNPPTTPP